MAVSPPPYSLEAQIYDRFDRLTYKEKWILKTNDPIILFVGV